MKIKKPSKVEISGMWPYAIVRISPGMKVELIDETATPEEAATGLRSIAAWLEKQIHWPGKRVSAMGKRREFCESATKGHKCVDDLCRGADITLCGFDQDEYDEMTADYGLTDEDTCFCSLCGAPFNDGGGLYCSAACEEAANPSGEL